MSNWIKEYGVKKISKSEYQTYAYVQDTGRYLTPITWLNETFKSKKEAKEWLDKQLKEKLCLI